jgi:hypothetical protein
MSCEFTKEHDNASNTVNDKRFMVKTCVLLGVGRGVKERGFCGR